LQPPAIAQTVRDGLQRLPRRVTRTIKKLRVEIADRLS